MRNIFSPLSSFFGVVLVGFAVPLNRVKLSSGDFPIRMQKKLYIRIVSFSVKCHVNAISLN